MLRAVVLTHYRRVTDRQTDRQTDGRTDGIAVASTALAMRALRRAVKELVLSQENATALIELFSSDCERLDFSKYQCVRSWSRTWNCNALWRESVRSQGCKKLCTSQKWSYQHFIPATQQPWSESSRQSSIGAAGVSHMHLWLNSGRRLTRRSFTGQSSNGIHVWGHAFKEEDNWTFSFKQTLSLIIHDQLVNVLETFDFHLHILNVNKTDVVVC